MWEIHVLPRFTLFYIPYIKQINAKFMTLNTVLSMTRIVEGNFV